MGEVGDHEPGELGGVMGGGTTEELVGVVIVRLPSFGVAEGVGQFAAPAHGGGAPLDNDALQLLNESHAEPDDRPAASDAAQE